MTVKCPDMHSKYTRPEELLHSEKVNQNIPVLREANPYRELYLEKVEVEPETDCDQRDNSIQNVPAKVELKLLGRCSASVTPKKGTIQSVIFK